MAKEPGKEEDNTLFYFIFGIAFLLLLSWLASHYQEYINQKFARLKIYETMPYMWWDATWSKLSEEILSGKRDLSQTPIGAIARYYNRFSGFVWLPFFAFLIWKVWRMETVEKDYTHEYTPQTLLETTSKMIADVAPWVHHDITKVDWNYGVWRLMDSPLVFLVRNKAILDPNGEPFHWNHVFDDCGDAPSLYVDLGRQQKDGDIVRIDDDWSSFDEGMKTKTPAHKAFVLPEYPLGSEAEEIAKFKSSPLTPNLESPYLNRDGHVVLNTLDERRLRGALIVQVGCRIREKDPFADLRSLAAREPKERWRYALAVAMFLHGYSNDTKRDARKILDAMNYSFADPGPIVPEKVNIADAMSKTLKWDSDQVFIRDVMPHATFTNPFFMALFLYARRLGVFVTGSFGWVRPFDRTLWHALSQTGRSVCSVEAAGAWSHYWAETGMGHPLTMPYLDIAIEGIRQEMILEGWLNAAHEEAMQNKKRGIKETNVFKAEERSCAPFGSDRMRDGIEDSWALKRDRRSSRAPGSSAYEKGRKRW